MLQLQLGNNVFCCTSCSLSPSICFHLSELFQENSATLKMHFHKNAPFVNSFKSWKIYKRQNHDIYSQQSWICATAIQGMRMNDIWFLNFISALVRGVGVIISYRQVAGICEHFLLKCSMLQILNILPPVKRGESLLGWNIDSCICIYLCTGISIWI